MSATKKQQKEFISFIIAGAQEVEEQTGILVPVTLAQAALESGWGLKTPKDKNTGAESNNLFGVKSRLDTNGNPTQESVLSDSKEYENGKWVWRPSYFVKYNTKKDSVLGRIDFFTRSDKYKKVREATDPITAFKELKNAGYATDPNYVNLLTGVLNTIGDYGKYDILVEDVIGNETKSINSDTLKSFYTLVSKYKNASYDSKTKNVQIEGKVYKKTTSTTHPIPDGTYYLDKSSNKSYIKNNDSPYSSDSPTEPVKRKQINSVPPWYKKAKDIDDNKKPVWNSLDKSITVINNGKKITYYPGEYFNLSGENYVEDYSEGRYKYTRYLDGLQHDPHRMKTINFKQDYTVIIRKKTHYAATQSNKNKENYLKVYQINDFTSITTSHHIENKGSASVTIRGGTKVVVADKRDVDDKGNARWKSTFDELIMSFNSIEREFRGVWKGIEYNDIQRLREAKYNWSIAEKCDFEPMDEVHIFSKSPVKNQDGYYDFKKIFFGYVTEVNKSFNTSNGPTISIQAVDQIRLLELSRVIVQGNAPGTETAGTAYRYDGAGNFIIEDDPQTYSDLDINDYNPQTETFGRIKSQNVPFQNIFAFIYLHEIIIRNCIAAGIPIEFLKDRIEEINRFPFFSDLNGKAELFNSEFKNRDQICKEGAQKLNVEFFCDEEGKVVLKIPTYNVGINRKPENNLGIDAKVVYDEGITTRYMKVGSEKINPANDSEYTYVPAKNETLWEIARRFYGDASMWHQVTKLNPSVVAYNGGNSYVVAGQTIVVKDKKTDKKSVESLFSDDRYKGENSFTLSSITDEYIPVIYPEEIIDFSFKDSDNGIYTSAQVTISTPLMDASMKGMPPAVTRSVADFDLIRKFGTRVLPVNGTTIPSSGEAAEVYAALLIMRSLAMRYTANIRMIENPNIKIGMPIRLFLYDEHLFTEIYRVDKNNDASMSQAIFYVEGISRSINVKDVSTMTLTLKAGRMAGIPSIYDKATELYRYFHDDVLIDGKTKQQSLQILNKEAVDSNSFNLSGSEGRYVLQSLKSIEQVTKEVYGNRSDYGKNKSNYADRIKQLNKQAKTMDVSNSTTLVDFKKDLKTSQVILLPEDANDLYIVKKEDNVGSIIHKVYQNNVDYMEAIEKYINFLKVKNPSFTGEINVGQALISPVNNSSYSVLYGDNIGSIIYRMYVGAKNFKETYAKDFSVFIAELNKLNQGLSYGKLKSFSNLLNDLVTGMQIIVPNVLNVSIGFSEDDISITSYNAKLSWNIYPDNTPVSSYTVFWAAKGKSFQSKKVDIGSSTTIDGLSENTEYDFYIKAVDEKGNQNIKTKKISKKTKISIVATKSLIGSDRVTINFTVPKNSENIETYKVRYGKSTNALSSEVTFVSDTTSKVVTGLDASTTYYFCVYGLDDEGNEVAESKIVNATTTKEE